MIKKFFELSDDDEAKVADMFPNGAEIKQGYNSEEKEVKEILGGDYMSAATVMMKFRYRPNHPQSDECVLNGSIFKGESELKGEILEVLE